MDFLKKFYDFDPQRKGIAVGRCKYCGGEYKDKIGSTGNFHKHLKRRHTKEYQQSRSRDPIVSDAEVHESTEYDSTSYDGKMNESIVTKEG